MSYQFCVESFEQTYAELAPMYRQHYAEMADRLLKDGIEVSAYNPRLDEYFKASRGGWLLNFV